MSEKIPINPAKALVCFSEAESFFQEGKFPEAIAALANAEEQDPQVADARFYKLRGDIRRRLREYPAAVEDYTRAVWLDTERSPELRELYGNGFGDPKWAVPVWIKLLKNTDLKVLGAVRRLGRYGPEANSAITELEALRSRAEDGFDCDVPMVLLRNEIQSTLTKICSPPPDDPAKSLDSGTPLSARKALKLVQQLVRRMGHVGWTGKRVEAAMNLGALGSQAQDAVPALIEALALADYQPQTQRFFASDLRAAAAQSLGKIGAAARIAVPQLHERLADNSCKVRVQAAAALWTLSEPASSVIPVLIEVLKIDSGEARIGAIQVLGSIGPEAAEAVPLLEAQDVLEPSFHAILALPKIQGNATPARQALKDKVVGFLIRWLNDPENRRMAIVDPADMIRMLAELGPEASEAVPWLTEAMWMDHSISVRRAASSALRRISRRLGSCIQT